MPTPSSQAQALLDLEGLADAAAKNAELFEGNPREIEALLSVVTEVRTLKLRQAELTAQRQTVTQQLTQALKRSQDVAIVFRALAKAKVGPRSELLTLFKVAPLRRQARKTKIIYLKEGETPGSGQGVTVSSSSSKSDV
jgi:hypothetical protein